MRTFEDNFSDALADIVYLSLEYCKKSVDKIFVHCLNDANCISSNVFFMKNEIKQKRSEIPGITDSEQIKFVHEINSKIKDIKNLFTNNRQPEPTEIKLIYEVSLKKLHTELSYSESIMQNEEATVQDLFNLWFNSIS
ncbi:MAG: hypothetical protein SPE03_08945 [Treponema sp.]|nr:hypothetical protein [Treponema sp.]